MTIGILWGMWPEATIDLEREIIKRTPALTDQDHIHIRSDNNPQIPPRVQHVLYWEGLSPAPVIIQMAKWLESWDCKLLVMPCNTATYYLPEIQKKIKTPILNIVQEAVEDIFRKRPNFKVAWIIWTEATIRIWLYAWMIFKKKLEILEKEICFDIQPLKDIIIKTFKSKDYYDDVSLGDIINKVKEPLKSRYLELLKEHLDFKVIAPSLEVMNNTVIPAIANVKAKKNNEATPQLVEAVTNLKNRGAEFVVMWCTEIPLALSEKDIDFDLINPTVSLAEAVIRIATYQEEIPHRATYNNY